MKVGNENPAKSATVPVISNPQSRPGVQLPGERTRKVDAGKAGNDVAGEANQVKVTTGGGTPSVAKQTWKGAESGYTTRSVPEYLPSPAADTCQDTEPNKTGSKPAGPGYLAGKVKLNGDIKRGGGSPKQSVKGKNPPRTDGEAKTVAGKASVTSY